MEYNNHEIKVDPISNVTFISSSGIPYSYYKKCKSNILIQYFIQRSCFEYCSLDVSTECLNIVIDILLEINNTNYKTSKIKKFICKEMINDIKNKRITDSFRSLLSHKFDGYLPKEENLYSIIYMILFVLGYVKIYGNKFNYIIDSDELLSETFWNNLNKYIK